MVGTKKTTTYTKEMDWRRSPDVWGTMSKVFAWGAIAGIILAIYAGCSDVGKDLKSNVPCKPTSSQGTTSNSNP